MSNWSQDISKAPRGQMIQQEQQRRGSDGNLKHVIVEQYVPEWIWAACKDGKHRPNGRWLNLTTDEQPVAWMRYVVPSHPGLSDQEAE